MSSVLKKADKLNLSLSGSLRRQDISSHDIDYVEYVGPGLTWVRILSTCVVSMWSDDIKCKYMFMFPLKNLARKGLILNNTDYLSMLGFNLNDVNKRGPCCACSVMLYWTVL